MSIADFKLAVLSLEFSDREIEQLFLKIKIKSERVIEELVEILGVHRPQLLKRLTSKYCSPGAD